jgi:hypothetical protein
LLIDIPLYLEESSELPSAQQLNVQSICVIWIQHPLSHFTFVIVLAGISEIQAALSHYKQHHM